MATMTALHERGLLAHELIQRRMRTPIVHLHTQMPLADIREWHREIHGRSPSSGLLPSMSTLLPNRGSQIHDTKPDEMVAKAGCEAVTPAAAHIVRPAFKRPAPQHPETVSLRGFTSMAVSAVLRVGVIAQNAPGPFPYVAAHVLDPIRRSPFGEDAHGPGLHNDVFAEVPNPGFCFGTPWVDSSGIGVRL